MPCNGDIGRRDSACLLLSFPGQSCELVEVFSEDNVEMAIHHDNGEEILHGNSVKVSCDTELFESMELYMIDFFK